MNNIKDIPDYAVTILIARVKKLGRNIFFYFTTGIISFIAIVFLMNDFNKVLRFITAVIIGLLLWLPLLGSFFERRNILSDLENGKMYLIEGLKKIKDNYLYNGLIYEPLIENDDILASGYVLLNSRILINNV